MFVTYALYSSAYDKLYIGCTQNLISRFHSHNSLAKKGYTVRYRPWIVIHVEFYNTIMEALKREKQLKSNRGRMFLRTLL
ncbi:MAG: GIY-YIG nuclease family protein [Aquirufa sp.]|jgi:putative endonuclease